MIRCWSGGLPSLSFIWALTCQWYPILTQRVMICLPVWVLTKDQHATTGSVADIRQSSSHLLLWVVGNPRRFISKTDARGRCTFADRCIIRGVGGLWSTKLPGTQRNAKSIVEGPAMSAARLLSTMTCAMFIQHVGEKHKSPCATHIVHGVVLDSASWREAKRGQSTNRKGEMSRASHQ